RGKVLNDEKARLEKLISSDQISSLVTPMGTSIGDEFDASKLRYQHIIIITDTDFDCRHARTAALGLFYRQTGAVAEPGAIYIAQPPLYKVKHGKDGRYRKDEHEMNQHMLRLALDKAQLIPSRGADPISGDALGELARKYLVAEAVIDRLSGIIA